MCRFMTFPVGGFNDSRYYIMSDVAWCVQTNQRGKNNQSIVEVWYV